MNISLAQQTTLVFKPKSQSEMIIDYLTSCNGIRIDTWTAYRKFNCTSLAQRIYDMRNKKEFHELRSNYKICDEVVNKYGKHFSEYWLERIL